VAGVPQLVSAQQAAGEQLRGRHDAAPAAVGQHRRPGAPYQERQPAQAGAGPQAGVGLAQRLRRVLQQGPGFAQMLVGLFVRHLFGTRRRHQRTPAEHTTDGSGTGVAALFEPVGQHQEPGLVVGALDAGGGQGVEVGHGVRSPFSAVERQAHLPGPLGGGRGCSSYRLPSTISSARL
jgi:hypothetical protein